MTARYPPSPVRLRCTLAESDKTAGFIGVNRLTARGLVVAVYWWWHVGV
ncbi:MAG: hypothetical protein U0893_12880 [Chloroflexota bacterium]